MIHKKSISIFDKSLDTMDMDDKEYGEQMSEATSILSVRPPSVN